MREEGPPLPAPPGAGPPVFNVSNKTLLKTAQGSVCRGFCSWGGRGPVPPPPPPPVGWGGWAPIASPPPPTPRWAPLHCGMWGQQAGHGEGLCWGLDSAATGSAGTLGPGGPQELEAIPLCVLEAAGERTLLPLSVCRRPVPRPPPVPAPPFCSTKRCPGAGCGPGPGSCGFVRGIPGDLAGPALPSLVRGCGPGPGRAPGAPRPRLPPTRGAGPNPYTGGSRAELGGGGACPPKGCSRGGV